MNLKLLLGQNLANIKFVLGRIEVKIICFWNELTFSLQPFSPSKDKINMRLDFGYDVKRGSDEHGSIYQMIHSFKDRFFEVVFSIEGNLLL
jgi:hypothetical protein